MADDVKRGRLANSEIKGYNRKNKNKTKNRIFYLFLL